MPARCLCRHGAGLCHHASVPAAGGARDSADLRADAAAARLVSRMHSGRRMSDERLRRIVERTATPDERRRDPDPAAPDAPLPAWCAILARVIEASRQTPTVSPAALLPSEIPFAILYEPLLFVAREELLARRGGADVPSRAAPDGQVALERLLLEELARLGERTLWASFENMRLDGGSDGSYAGFVRALLSDGLGAFFDDHAALARVWARAIVEWSASSVELLDRVAADAGALVAHLGVAAPPLVVDVVVPRAPARAGEPAPLVVTFAGGARAAYLPRSIARESALVAAVEWLTARGSLTPIDLPATIDRGSYGWIAHRDERAADGDVETAARDAGRRLALAHLFGVTDLLQERRSRWDAAAPRPVPRWRWLAVNTDGMARLPDDAPADDALDWRLVHLLDGAVTRRATLDAGFTWMYRLLVSHRARLRALGGALAERLPLFSADEASLARDRERLRETVALRRAAIESAAIAAPSEPPLSCTGSI